MKRVKKRRNPKKKTSPITWMVLGGAVVILTLRAAVAKMT